MAIHAEVGTPTGVGVPAVPAGWPAGLVPGLVAGLVAGLVLVLLGLVLVASLTVALEAAFVEPPAPETVIAPAAPGQPAASPGPAALL